jgi:tetratricopeptide (TPR) repeat protein
MKKLLLVLVLFATTTIYAQSYNQGFRDGWLNVNNGIGAPSVPVPKIGRTTYKDGFADGAAAGAKAGNSGSNRSNMKADDWAKVYGAGNYSDQSNKIGNSVNNAINENRQRRQSSNNNSSRINYAYYNSGRDKHDFKDYEGAIKDYNIFINQYPNFPAAFYDRGLSYIMLGNMDKGCSEIKIAVDMGDSIAKEFYESAGCSEFTNSKRSSSEVDYTYYNRALEKFNGNKYTAGIKDISIYINQYPNDSDGWNLRGVLKHSTKDYDGAVKDYDKAIKLEPKNFELYSSRGQSKYFLKTFNESFSDFNISLKLNPENGKAWCYKGFINEIKKDYKGALIDYTKAIEFNYLTPYGPRGDIKAKLKDMDGACADWNEALSKGNEAYQEKIDENCSGMTKEKAIAKLKELKELLELEVITQKDYDKEKAILTPIILGKN